MVTSSGRTASGRCFDHDFYRHQNPDLETLHNDAVYLHFSVFGRFEARKYLLKECPPESLPLADAAELAMHVKLK